VVTKKREAVTPPALVEELLFAAGDNVVLVGGQALAFWVRRYDVAVPADVPAISNDTDFLTRSAADKASVERFARVIGGHVFYPSLRALTSLVGQAYRDISEDEFVNVDVIFSVVGIDAEAIRSRAVKASLTGRTVQVMHPLDVLLSRLINLHQIAENQNVKGVMQLAMAIDAGREFLRDEARKSAESALASGRSPVQGYVSAIERMAVGDAGQKVAARHGVHVADAIDPSPIPAGPFWSKRWPALKQLMSTAYAAQFTSPPPASTRLDGSEKRRG
jgi:hypothetical protein